MAERQTPRRDQTVDPGAFYDYFIPYIERAHERNVRGLKAGVWLLFLLPFILVAIQVMTGASRIVFLIFWIVAMFIIASVLIYAAYSDNDLKKMLRELKEVVPTAREVEIGELLPVDAEGEGWLIEPEKLAELVHASPEDLLAFREELRERVQERQTRAESRREAIRGHLHHAEKHTPAPPEENGPEEQQPAPVKRKPAAAGAETEPARRKETERRREPERRRQPEQKREPERGRETGREREPAREKEAPPRKESARKGARPEEKRREEPYKPRHMKPESGEDRPADTKRKTDTRRNSAKRK